MELMEVNIKTVVLAKDRDEAVRIAIDNLAVQEEGGVPLNSVMLCQVCVSEGNIEDVAVLEVDDLQWN